MSTNSFKFHVIEFIKTEEVEIVPDTWLRTIFNEGTAQLHCLWPKYSDARVYDMAKSGQSPLKNWKLFPARSFHVYGNYEEAEQNVDRFMVHSDVSEPERKKRKPAKKPKPRIVARAFTDDDSNSESETGSRSGQLLLLPPPAPAQLLELPCTSQTVLLTNDNDFGAIESDHNINSEEGVHSIFIETPENHQTSESFIGKTTSSHPLTVPVVIPEDKFQKSVLSKLHTISSKLDRLLEVRDKISCNRSPGASPAGCPKAFELPLKTYSDMDKLEQDLLIPENRQDLVLHLSQKGGNSFVDVVNVMLKRLCTDDLLQSYSYYGKATKKKFSDMKICGVIFDAVRLNSEYALAKDAEIRDKIQVFITNAPHRLKRKRIELFP